MKLLLTVVLVTFVFMCALTLNAQQMTCTSSVPPTSCRQFDAAFGQSSLWPNINFTKNVVIVIVDPVQFNAERAKVDAENEAVAKRRKTVGDINRAGGREAGGGMFEHEILQCPTSNMVERIVISTDAIRDSEPYSAREISDHLLFYVVGYDQGFLQGVAGALP